jgi:hypothetical protein
LKPPAAARWCLGRSVPPLLEGRADAGGQTVWTVHPPSAPVRALSASAPRTTSVVRPADPRTLNGTSRSPRPADRWFNVLPGLDAGATTREARDPIVLDISRLLIPSRLGAPAAWGGGGLPRGLSTVSPRGHPPKSPFFRGVPFAWLSRPTAHNAPTQRHPMGVSTRALSALRVRPWSRVRTIRCPPR